MRSPILRDFWVQRQTQRAAVEIPFSVFRIFKFLIRVIRFIRGSQSSHFCQGCDSRIERRISWSCPIAAVRRGLRSQSRPSSPIVIVVKGDGSGTAVVLFAARPVCCSSCLLLVLFTARPVYCSSCLLLVLFAARPVCCRVKYFYFAHWICG